MAYNTTFFNTSNNLMDFAQGVNDSTGGLFIISILLTLWFLIFLSTRKSHNVDDRLLFSNFAVLLVSIIFWAGKLIQDYVVLVPLLLLVFTLIYKKVVN